MNIERADSGTELKTIAGRKVHNLFSKNSGKPILFLTSGGSGFELLEKIEISEGLKISVGVLDERYSTDPTVNNFTQFKNTLFFQRSQNMFEHVLDTSVLEHESLEEFADRYESMLQSWMVMYPSGAIIATIGMGPDGHISGMMPFPEDTVKFQKLFNDAKRLVTGYDAGDKNPYKNRATTTMEFMRRIHHAVAYITGEGKREAWERVTSENGTLAETPARILKDMEDVTVFTDLS